jgi:hypothetical protein
MPCELYIFDPLPWSNRNYARVVYCRTEECRAPVFWSVTEAGKPCLFDVDTSGDQPIGTDVSHFRTCSAPRSWSKKR